MGKKFDGKHALVTGGARGLGFEIAREFIFEGATISIFDINKESIKEVKKYNLEQCFELAIKNNPKLSFKFEKYFYRPGVNIRKIMS